MRIMTTKQEVAMNTHKWFCSITFLALAITGLLALPGLPNTVQPIVHSAPPVQDDTDCDILTPEGISTAKPDISRHCRSSRAPWPAIERLATA
jgi:hypothetical protein